MAVFFANSRLWLGGNLWCRLRKLAAFEDSKMACSNRQCFGCEKDLFFSSCKATRKRKAFSQHSKTSTFRHTQTNGSQQISSVKSYCELAVHLLFFETLQSCVCTTVTLSHRFKFSPAIPGNLAVFCAAGYMMMAGHFCESHVSSGDLNRSLGVQRAAALGVFLVTFCTPQKVTTRSLCREHRGFPNLDSAHKTTTSH